MDALEITPFDIMMEEVPMLEKITADEKWYESEQRGYEVPACDRAVQLRIHKIILDKGELMRAEAISAITARRMQR